MPSRSIEVTFNGDEASQTEGVPVSIGLEGPVTLGRCRVKKSSSAGTCLLNFDCSGSMNSKYLSLGDGAFNIDPQNVASVYSNNGDLDEIPNSYTGDLMTAATGEEPTFGTSGQNITSKPVIQIGSTSKLKYTSNAPEFASGEPFTIFVVVDEADNQSFRPVLGSANTSGFFTSSTWYGNNNSRKVYVRNDAGTALTSSGSDAFQDSDIRVLRRDSSNNVTEYRRGVQTISGSLSGDFKFPNLGWTANQVMGSTATYIFNGLKVSRVIICDEYFDDDAREYVEAWLAWEYGLQTLTNSYLPSSHVGYQVNPRGTITKSFSSDFDLSGLSANTYSSLVQPSISTISGPITFTLEKVHKIGYITVEVNVSY